MIQLHWTRVYEIAFLIIVLYIIMTTIFVSALYAIIEKYFKNEERLKKYKKAGDKSD